MSAKTARLGAVGLIVAATALVSGCSAAPQGAADAQNTAAAQDPAVLQRAVELTNRFNALVEQGFRDGAFPQELNGVATTAAIGTVQGDLDAFLQDKLRLEGASSLDTQKIESVEGDPNSKGKIRMSACWDISSTRLMSADGEKQRGEDERVLRTFEIEATGTSWLVSSLGGSHGGDGKDACKPK